MTESYWKIDPPPERKYNRWLEAWYFHVTDDDVALMTPLFELWISDGGNNFLSRTMWWGFEFGCWFNRALREGEYVFLKRWRVVFKEENYDRNRTA